MFNGKDLSFSKQACRVYKVANNKQKLDLIGDNVTFSKELIFTTNLTLNLKMNGTMLTGKQIKASGQIRNKLSNTVLADVYSLTGKVVKGQLKLEGMIFKTKDLIDNKVSKKAV